MEVKLRHHVSHWQLHHIRYRSVASHHHPSIFLQPLAQHRAVSLSSSSLSTNALHAHMQLRASLPPPLPPLFPPPHHCVYICGNHTAAILSPPAQAMMMIDCKNAGTTTQGFVGVCALWADAGHGGMPAMVVHDITRHLRVTTPPSAGCRGHVRPVG